MDSKELKAIKLFYKDIHVCDVVNTGGDFPWVHGKFTKCPAFDRFKDFFAFTSSDDWWEKESESGFDKEWFNDENWTLHHDDGEIENIFLPWIEEKDSCHIGYRYR